MKLTDLFIRRPVLAIVVNLVIVIAGLQAIRSINVRQYPRSENAAVTVTTTYVGANAALVRGFVTTPLERVIAAADGSRLHRVGEQAEPLDHPGAPAAQLRRHPGARRDLARRSTRCAAICRPEAEIPILNIESADSQFASAYLSFSSELLKQNEITDYLVRVVQPRLSSVEGVQRADILGARTFAMRIWLKPDRMAALNVSPAQVRQALASNNYLAAVGQTKGSLVQVNLTANTDLRSVGEFQQLVVREQRGAVVRLGDVADVVLGAEDYDAAVNFSGQTAVFIGVWSLPNANSLDVIERVRAEMATIQRDLPEQLKAVIAYDATRYIQSAIRDVERTLAETLLIVVVVIFLFLGLAALGARPGGGDPGVARRGGVPHAGVRVHPEPADAARDRALGGARRRRRDRGGRERGAAPARGEDRGGRGAHRRARARRADHRHDDHARGGLHAHRVPGRPHRRAVPRVRAHARRRGHHLGRRGAHALARDVGDAAPPRAGGARAARPDQPRLRPAAGASTRGCSTLALGARAGHLRGLGRGRRARVAHVRAVAEGARPDRGSGGDLRDREHPARTRPSTR